MFSQFFHNFKSSFTLTLFFFVLWFRQFVYKHDHLFRYYFVILKDSCLTGSSFLYTTVFTGFSVMNSMPVTGWRNKWSIGNYDWYWTRCADWSTRRLPRDIIMFCGVSTKPQCQVFKCSEEFLNFWLQKLLKCSSINDNTAYKSTNTAYNLKW